MSARQRLTFAAIAVLIAVVAVVAIAASGGGSGGTDDPAGTERPTTAVTTEATPEPTATQEPRATRTPEPEVLEVVVRGGEPVGGVKELQVTEGERVRFTVVSDVADHVHVHGYDLMKDVSAGGRTTFSFRATITGIFEAELEDRGVQIVSVRVDPK